MTRRVQLLLGGMLVLAACGSGTKITRTWTGRDPTLGLKTGDLVAVGLMTTNERDRLDHLISSLVRAAESEMA